MNKFENNSPLSEIPSSAHPSLRPNLRPQGRNEQQTAADSRSSATAPATLFSHLPKTKKRVSTRLKKVERRHGFSPTQRLEQTLRRRRRGGRHRPCGGKRRVRFPARPLGMRQDHHPANDRRLRRRERRAD